MPCPLWAGKPSPYRRRLLILIPIMSNEYQGVFSIQSFELLEGNLPKRVVSLVLEWAFDHKKELMENWELAMKKQALKKIDPLV